MTYTDYLRSQGATEADIQVLDTPLARRLFDKQQADLAAATERATALEGKYTKANTDLDNFNKWYTDEAVPMIDRANNEIIAAKANEAKARTALQIAQDRGLINVAKDLGYDLGGSPLTTSTTPATTTSASGFDPTKYFTKDELVGEINKFGGSLAALEDMVSEHAYLFPGSRLNVTKLREEALATKKNVNQVWEEKYKVSEARAAREAADKKAYEDKLRKEGADAERAKFADQYGNPNLRTPEPSINTFAPRKEGERAGKQPWEVNQDLGMDRVRRATQKVIAEQSGRA